MSTHSYDREGFLSEFFPDATDRAEVESGAQALIKVSRMNVRQERVSAIERAKVDTTELRTLPPTSRLWAASSARNGRGAGSADADVAGRSSDDAEGSTEFFVHRTAR